MKSNKNFLARFRGWIQAAATLLTNIHIPNLFKGKIYQGNVKTMCVPGLNCYSCPAATGACPIGAFQAVVGSSKFKFTYYITGFFILLGVLLGRFICGFLCPFGLLYYFRHLSRIHLVWEILSSANTFAHRAYLKAQFRWHLPTQESVPHSDIYLHLSSQSLRFSSS